MNKCYVFVNRYLGDKQAGIQSAHAVVRLGQTGSEEYEIWANNYETLVLLNGGDHNRLVDLARLFGQTSHEIGVFREPGLNDCITAIAFIPNEDMRLQIFEFNQNPEMMENPENINSTDDEICAIITKSRSFRG